MVADTVMERTGEQSVSRSGRFRTASHPRILAAFLTGLAIVLALVVVSYPAAFSHSVFVPLLVVAGLFLSGRELARAVAAVVLAYLVTAALTWHSDGAQWSVGAVVVSVVAILALVAYRRRAMSVSLSDSTELLGDLRARLDHQALLPALGEEFRAETCVMPSVGEAFSGDFSVSARHGNDFQLALTDVSGHGQSAGMRALLLSGALSGLLGSVPVEQFLPSANRYLIRQGWRDGFASCIHVCIDLSTGAYDIGTAGHPSAAHFRANTRTWEMVSGAAGLLLGLFELEASDYARARGVLEPGDILLLYTDGVVEGEGGDIAVGTQRMLAQADVAVSDGMEGAAERICAASLHAGGEDDRSAVMIWRNVPEARDNREHSEAPHPTRG